MAKQLGLFEDRYPHSPAHTSDDTSIAAAEDLNRIGAARHGHVG